MVEFWEEEAAERVVRELDGVGLPGGGQGGLRGGEVRIAVEREPGVAVSRPPFFVAVNSSVRATL